MVTNSRINQCTLSSVYKFHSKKYMDEVFSKVEMGYSYQKLKLPHRKTNQGLRALSYVSLVWNNLDLLKTSASLNTFKHDIKNQFFRMNNK